MKTHVLVITPVMVETPHNRHNRKAKYINAADGSPEIFTLTAARKCVRTIMTGNPIWHDKFDGMRHAFGHSKGRMIECKIVNA